MKIEEFRIVEQLGVFRIQRKKDKSRTNIFGKKIENIKWVFVDVMGHEIAYSMLRLSFTTKEEAVSQIEKICNPIIYHYPPFK